LVGWSSFAEVLQYYRLQLYSKLLDRRRPAAEADTNSGAVDDLAERDWFRRRFGGRRRLEIGRHPNGQRASEPAFQS
jgi:hypothetical protein